MILVTGATGLVGSHLLVQLLQENEEVKALFRSEKQLEKVKHVFGYHDQTALFDKINWVKGDITDIPSLEIAFENVTHVYHCAALISFDPSDEDKLRKINSEGTANVVNCCLDFGIKKLCHVSSIAALGNPKEHETTITEETEWNQEELHSDYAITKYGAEMEVWRGNQEGLDIIIVNPGVIFGFGFPNQGSDAIIQSVKRGQRFYTKGTIAIVSVNDVVKSMIALMNSSISGEKFIVVGENLSLEHFLLFVARTFGIKKPNIYANKTLTEIAWRMDWLYSFLTGNKRKFTKTLAHSAHNTTFVSNQKISEKIGFTFQKKEEYIIPE